MSSKIGFEYSQRGIRSIFSKMADSRMLTRTCVEYLKAASKIGVHEKMDSVKVILTAASILSEKFPVSFDSILNEGKLFWLFLEGDTYSYLVVINTC